MNMVKFLLVLLFCVPVGVLVWYLFNNLVETIAKQQKKAERLRKNKAMFQENTELESNYEADRQKPERRIIDKMRVGTKLIFRRSTR